MIKGQYGTVGTQASICPLSFVLFFTFQRHLPGYWTTSLITMDIYAKSRRRLRHIDHVAIVEDKDLGFYQMLLEKRGGRLWPIGMQHFASQESAKREAAKTFKIRSEDWSELPDGLIPEPEPAALEAFWQRFDEFQKRPWESDPLIQRRPSTGSSAPRKQKELLLGRWRWGRYELRFEKDTWQMSFEGEMLIRPMAILQRFQGPYNCSGGMVAFADGIRGTGLWIAHLDKSKLVLTDCSTFTAKFERG